MIILVYPSASDKHIAWSGQGCIDRTKAVKHPETGRGYNETGSTRRANAMKREAKQKAHEALAEERGQARPDYSKAAQDVEPTTTVDSTSALLRRDSEQFALAADDDDDHIRHRSSLNSLPGQGASSNDHIIR